MGDLLISQLAELSGIPVTTLRFYENTGLLPAARTSAGYRVFDGTAVERLEVIGAAKRLGLPLEGIAGLLAVWAEGSCAQVRADLRSRLAARIAETRQRAAGMAESETALRQAVEHLDVIADRVGRCGPQCFAGPPPAGAMPAAPRPGGRDARDGHGGNRDERDEGEAWPAVPIVCSLSGQDMRQRAGEWRMLLDGARREPVPGGLRLIMPADRAGRVAELAVAEQGCCTFFDFRLHLRAATIHLEVRAPAAAAGLLADLFGSAG